MIGMSFVATLSGTPELVLHETRQSHHRFEARAPPSFASPCLVRHLVVEIIVIVFTLQRINLLLQILNLSRASQSSSKTLASIAATCCCVRRCSSSRRVSALALGSVSLPSPFAGGFLAIRNASPFSTAPPGSFPAIFLSQV